MGENRHPFYYVLRWLAKRLMEFAFGAVTIFVFSFVFGYFESDSAVKRAELSLLLTMLFLLLSPYLVFCVLIGLFATSADRKKSSLLFGSAFLISSTIVAALYTATEILGFAIYPLVVTGGITVAAIEYIIPSKP